MQQLKGLLRVEFSYADSLGMRLQIELD